MDGRVDEIQRPEEIRPHLNPFPLECGVQLVKLFYVPRDIHSIGFVLSGNDENDPGFPLDRSCSKRWSSIVSHISHLPKGDVCAVLTHQHRGRDLFWSNLLTFGLEDKPLIAVLDEACALYPRGLLCCGDHIVERQIELHKLFWTELHLYLPDFSAKH